MSNYMSGFGDFMGDSLLIVGKVANKVVERGCEFVGKLFGFLKNRVRFSAFSCSVEKFFGWISTFGFVRFTSVFRRDFERFPHFPHSLLLLLYI